MAKASARNQGSLANGVTHYGAIRYRIIGSGTLQTTLYSLQDVESQTLANITMSNPNDRMPTILANFNKEQAFLKGETNEMNDYFRINRIIIYTKPIWSGYPQ